MLFGRSAGTKPGICWKGSGGSRGTTAAAMARDFLDNLIVVRKGEGDDDMTIRMVLPPTGRQRNMCRKKDEPIAKPLERIRRTVSSACLGKGGKDERAREAKKSRADNLSLRTDTADLGVTCTMLDQFGEPVPETTANSDAWRTGYTLELKYTTKEDQAEVRRLKIEENLPACSDLSLPRHIIAGDVPVSPFVSLEFCSSGDCEWSWYAEKAGTSEWELIGQGEPEITLPLSVVGKRIKVRCEPGSGGRLGEPRDFVSDSPVIEAPSLEFIKSRHATMVQRAAGAPDTLRVMTYNILADVYSKTDYAKEVLYPDIRPEHLSTDYRQQVSLFEISGFESDVICMQEMDSIWFDKFWSPKLRSKGFGGYFSRKTSKVEGCAMFWREDKLRAVATEEVHIRDLFGDDKWVRDHLGEQAASKIASDRNLGHILRKVSTAAQFALFEAVGGVEEKRVLVVNTHLYFHPGASHVRSLSVAAMLAHAKDLLRARGQENWSVLVCGDLNSEPDTAVIEILAKGSVSADHYEWRDCAKFAWKDKDDDNQGFEMDEDLKYELNAHENAPEACAGFDLGNPFGPLRSSDGLRSAFTNYVKGYIGSLDYIFYQGGEMRLEGFAPLPQEKDLCRPEDLGPGGEVVTQGYLPSQSFPSDHVSLVADFSFPLPGSGPGGGPSEEFAGSWPPPEDRPVMPLPASRWNEGQAAEALRKGRIIALPTDTIYGVAALASSDEGIDRIYDAKQRPAFLPLALCIAEASDVGRYGDASHLPEGLVEEFLPGPYTLLLNKRGEACLSERLNPDTPTVGIRVPESSFVRGVAAHLGYALALTSANISGQRSSTEVGHFREIWQKFAHVYDGGSLNAGASGSTIIDLSKGEGYRVVRKGCSEEEAVRILEKYGVRPLA